MLKDMGIKGLHQYLRNANILQQNVNIPQQLVAHNINIVFVDFCCEFMSLLQSTSGVELLRLALRGGNAEDNINVSRIALNNFLQLTMESLQRLLDSIPGLTICLVIDGEPLYAKKETHQARKQRRKDGLNLARKKLQNTPDASDAQLIKYTKQWVSFSANTKNYIIDWFGHHPECHPYDNENLDQQGIVFLSAPFEADPVVVHQANLRPNSAIISRDGDLFAYYGAVDVPVCITYN